VSTQAHPASETQKSLATPEQIQNWVVIGGRIALALALLWLWDVSAQRLGELFVARPADILQRGLEISRSGQLWVDMRATLAATGAGFAIGWVLGVLLPLLLISSARATRAIEPYVIASMGIPKFALAPLLILWFGIGLAPKIVIVAFMVFYMIFINTFAGLRTVDKRLVDMSRVLGATQQQVVRNIFWPWMQPFLFSGLRLAVPRALSAAIVGEFLVADRGLGHYIENARQTGDTVGVFTGIVVVTLLVLALSAVLNAIERRALAWRPTVSTSL
jgi:NitT/TauT family transport system permease protein